MYELYILYYETPNETAKWNIYNAQNSRPQDILCVLLD